MNATIQSMPVSMEANPALIHLIKPKEVRPVAKEIMMPNQTTVSQAALSFKTSPVFSHVNSSPTLVNA